MRLFFLNVTPEMDCCGVLICKNDDVTMEMIQEKIDDLKIATEEADEEWYVPELIKSLPKEWEITLKPIKDNVYI